MKVQKKTDLLKSEIHVLLSMSITPLCNNSDNIKNIEVPQSLNIKA